MKSEEVLKKVEAEAVKVGAVVIDESKKAKGWLKRAWQWAWSTSWKTKTTVGVILLAVLLCGMASLYVSPAPTYVTRSEASVMLSARAASMQSSLDAMSRRMDGLESDLHQTQIELRAVEDKLASKKITTGSLPKKTPVRRYVRKPASSSWLDLP